MNWFINKFKSSSLMTQAAFEIFYCILFIALVSNAIAYSWNEIPMIVIFTLIGAGTLWYHIYDIIKKIKNDNKIDVKK